VSLGRYNSTFSRGGIETASDGRFRVTGLPVGTYDVYVELEGYTQSYSTMQIEVGGNAVVIPIQRAADESSGGSTTGPGAVTVELVDQDDVPIDIGSVSILPPSGLYFDSRTGLPDSAGRAAFSNLALGPWEVTAYASAADGSSLLFPTKIADLTSTDFAETVRLAGGAPSRITGTIDLNEFSSDVVYVALFDDRGRLRSSGDVDENGAFTIQRVAPGSYYLQLGGGFGVSGDWVGPPPEILPGQVYWSSTTTSGVANMSDATLITVGSGTESGNHRLAATAGATVTGQIEIAGPTGASALPPTRCAYVLPYREIGSEWRLVDVETWACGAEPIFGKGMPAGRYKFQIGDFYSGSSAILPSYVGGATLETATVFDLVAGQVRDLGTIVAQVAPPGSTLQAVDLAFLLQNGVDISLYEDLISASDQLESGGDVTIEVGDDLAGQYVNVSANSTPQVVGETWQQVAADGTVTVTLPPDLVGSHKLVVADTTGQLVGWTAVEIAQGTSTGGSTGGTSSGGSSTASKPAGKVATTSEATPVPTTTATASPTPTPVATEGPEATPSTEPQTASGAPGGDGGWIIWVVGGGLVVLVGAAAVLIFRRRLV
jgi:hypothetical protein